MVRASDVTQGASFKVNDTPWSGAIISIGERLGDFVKIDCRYGHESSEVVGYVQKDCIEAVHVVAPFRMTSKISFKLLTPIQND